MAVDTNERKTSREHWYRITIGECPLCGADKGYRERVYGPKPANDEERYVYLTEAQAYDWCLP